MPIKSGSWYCPFSPALEDFIIYSSNEFSGLKNPESKDYKLASKLTFEEIEAWNMWLNKQNGIMPTQYHWTYNQGDTILYPEHIADIFTIDKMWNNRIKYKEGEQKRKEESKAFQAKMKTGQKVTTQNKGGASNFFGKKYQYTK